MAYEQIKLTDLVNRAVEHKWSIPEFQRGFVWKPVQVRDLAESLWLNYPIGSLLIWNSSNGIQARTAIDSKNPSDWLVDGQQRSTALCILFGRKPYWWENTTDWNNVLKRYDIRFDIHAVEAPYFLVANAGIRNAKSSRYIKLSDLLNLDTQKDDDQKSLTELSKKIKLEGLCDGKDQMEVYTRLDRLRKIREKDIVAVTIEHELEDVVEIFSRLNSRGTRVTEADIYLGVVAARNPTWVRDTFIPYLDDLDNYGFHIDPNLLFRSLTGIGEHATRFKNIRDDFWDKDQILPAWKRTHKFWESLILRFKEYGILTNSLMPTQAALVTMVALIDKFNDDSKFSKSLYWFLQASRFSRYSGSGTTSLDEDLKDIYDSTSFDDAIDKLLKRFRHEEKIEAEEFLRDYSDTRFGRFILYLLVYKNNAQDWDQTSHKLGFEGVSILSDFQPQWHHIFPKEYLKGNVSSDSSDSIDYLANIAVIGQSINIRISNKMPMSYIMKYNITEDKLIQQFIDPDFVNIGFNEYETWLNKRAEILAEKANEYLANLIK
jgi:hypothetical protein